jgi:hypothetical protein
MFAAALKSRPKKGASMIKTAAVLFGIVFILIGILGLVPGATDHHQMLLGIFHVNAAHNVVHLLSGAAALFAGMTSTGASRIYFRVFGVVYGLVAGRGIHDGRRHAAWPDHQQHRRYLAPRRDRGGFAAARLYAGEHRDGLSSSVALPAKLKSDEGGWAMRVGVLPPISRFA